MEEKAMSPRQQALRAIQAGESVVVTVDGRPKQFTMANVHEMPDESAFVQGDPDAQKRAQEAIRSEIERLQAIEKNLASANQQEAPKEEVKVSEETTTEQTKVAERKVKTEAKAEDVK